MNSLTDLTVELCRIGTEFHHRGWSLATSSNYSVVLQRHPFRLLVTASGRDKSRLNEDDFVQVGSDGGMLQPGDSRPSAETLLHVLAAHTWGANAVLHTHSTAATVLSDVFFTTGGIELQGYEMLKGLAGQQSHEQSRWLPIFENTQDIPVLAQEVAHYFADAAQTTAPGYLIRRHGLYTWGNDLAEARRHVEAIEFLLQCVAFRLQMPEAAGSELSTVREN